MKIARKYDGFTIGDLVIADKAIFDTFEDTWVITGFSLNRLGQVLAEVRSIENSDRETVFYTRELSHTTKEN